MLPVLMRILQQYQSQGFDEMDAFDDLADWFEEDGVDAAIPLLAGFAARTLARPLIQRAGTALTQQARRTIVRSATQAARTLVRRRGRGAVRVLPRVAQSVARVTARRRIPARAAVQTAARAVQQTASRVAAQPRLVQQLAARPLARPAPGLPAAGRRFRVAGPVEITVRRLR